MSFLESAADLAFGWMMLDGLRREEAQRGGLCRPWLYVSAATSRLPDFFVGMNLPSLHCKATISACLLVHYMLFPEMTILACTSLLL